MGFADKTDIYSGQENDPKVFKFEYHNMAKSGSFVIWSFKVIARPEN